jgi:dienelactone hydrolase
MHRLAVGTLFAVLLFAACGDSLAADSLSLPAGVTLNDIRLKPQRTLQDKYHPWSPPESKEAWEKEAERIRRQLLVSNGLWPLPEKTPLDPVIHGLSDRGDYTVEKVFFRSRPGVYVTGSLYRPKKPSTEKRPAVLCPHGHWLNGRFQDETAKAAAEGLASGAESYLSGAKHPLQAIEVQLARMGCIAFIYDTVGTADNLALPHREGFNDVAAELWLQNKMGLQTWNSIRALDFIESLPDVDPRRIGVTGASGGGTQTFMLCALDPRPAVAFPAVMVGTAMQGGCQCENASYLRHDINNVAIAALIAPRPLAMTGANDWTIDIETKGLPELKKVYGFYGKEDHVAAKCFAHFPHNYNEVSREMMFAWMAKHFGLEGAPVEQSDFWPMTRDQLTVFDDKHPKPADWLNAEKLRAEMTKESRATMAGLKLSDEESLERYRKVVGEAADIMLGIGAFPASGGGVPDDSTPGVHRVYIELDGHRVPIVWLAQLGKLNGEAVVWMDGRGKAHLLGEDGKPKPAVQKLLDAGYLVASADVALAGAQLEEGKPASYPVNSGFPGYTYCYNRPLLALRVREVAVTRAIAGVIMAGFLRDGGKPKSPPVHVVGTGNAGLWVLLSSVFRKQRPAEKVIVDLNRFSFEHVTKVDDPNLLPGALKYGDLDGLAALAAPAFLSIHRPSGNMPLLSKATAITKGWMEATQDELTDDAVVEQIMRPR